MGVLALTLAGAMGGGCAPVPEPPELLSIQPVQAYADEPVVARVLTRGLRPALQVGIQGGGLSLALPSVRMRLVPEGGGGVGDAVGVETLYWNAADSFWVRVPADLPAGPYALELTDPRGAVTTLASAFTGLGADPDPPEVELQGLPEGNIIGSAKMIVAQAVADDGAGFLESFRWSVDGGDEHACVIPSGTNGGDQPPVGATRAVCSVPLKAPLLRDGDPTMVPMSLHLVARDVAGHESARDIPLRAAKLPKVEGFQDVLGGLGGWQPFSVRGRFFIPGSRAFLGGVPILSGVLTEGADGLATISGWTPPRARAESVEVEVRSPAGPGFFDERRFVYLGPPRPRDIQPPVGPTRGGIRVTVRGNDLYKGVVIYVGKSREVRQPLYAVSYEATISTKVVGCLPPGEGTVSVWTYDPVTGDGELPMAFTYQDPPEGDPQPPIASECL